MLWETLKAARDLGRMHDIASVLIRYGFGDVVKRLGMSRVLEQAGKVLRWKGAEHALRMDSPERVRRAFEELGPTFVKLGQILATRVDLFSPEWIREFEKLQDEVPPLPFDDLYEQLKEDLGEEPTKVFTNLETQALAAGSIGQVHRATLKNGQRVVLKIRRPGIQSIIEADLRLLYRLATIAEKEIPESQYFHPVSVVKQVTRTLRRELDFAAEARNVDHMAVSFNDDPNIGVPYIHWQWTSERLNVQTYIDGIPGRDLEAVEKAGLDKKLLARRGANAVLKMVVEHGFFHADPHPGNVFYLPGNRIVFIDLGMVGRLSEQRRQQVVDLIQALISRDTPSVIDVLLEWSEKTDLSEENLASDIDAFLDSYHGVPLKNLNIANMLTDLTAAMRSHGLAMPPDLALLMKVFITLEGLGRQLDPEFDMISEAEPYVHEAIRSRYRPEALLRRGWRDFSALLSILSSLPHDLRRVIKSMRRGAMQMNVDINQLEHFGRELNRAANRLTVGMVTSALIIGTSIVMTVKGGPTLFGWPLLGLLGFLGAGISGIWLLVSIWRSGRGY